MTTTWSEADSRLYAEIASIAVPARIEQLAALLTLIPFAPTDPFRVVEIGAGEGWLSAALLTCFPQAAVTALDGSAEMRAAAQTRLAAFGPRAAIHPFELAADDWYAHLDNAELVVSSLCLHHLTGEEKRRLFAEIVGRLPARGALLIADLVAPQRPEEQALFAATWDEAARAQSLARTGNTALFEKFKQAEWNLYRYPDPVDKPSPLFAQLAWLQTAGLAVVDCFWLQAGHAIYGGYKSQADSPAARLPFETALAAVNSLLG